MLSIFLGHINTDMLPSKNFKTSPDPKPYVFCILTTPIISPP